MIFAPSFFFNENITPAFLSRSMDEHRLEPKRQLTLEEWLLKPQEHRQSVRLQSRLGGIVFRSMACVRLLVQSSEKYHFLSI